MDSFAKKNKKRRPIYQMTMGQGVDFLSLVRNPALETKPNMNTWKAFSDEAPVKLVAFKNDQQQMMLMGPILVPDLLIYRNEQPTVDNPNALGEYDVYFTAQDIQNIMMDFNRSLKGRNLNIEHNDGRILVAGFVNENWIVEDTKKDKSALHGFSVPVGTAMVTVKIDNQKFWDEEVMTGNLRGFSIEGYLGMKQITQSKHNTMDKTKLEAQAVTTDGVELYTPTDFVVGAEIYILNADGTTSPLPDSTYTLDNGDTVTCVAGVITDTTAVNPSDKTAPNAPAAPTGQSAEVPAGTPKSVTVTTKYEAAPVEASYTNEDTVAELAKYPGGWDQCIIDMEQKYGNKESAQKICAAIKNGTVNHSAEVQPVAQAAVESPEVSKLKSELETTKAELAKQIEMAGKRRPAVKSVVKTENKPVSRFAAKLSPEEQRKQLAGLFKKDETNKK